MFNTPFQIILCKVQVMGLSSSQYYNITSSSVIANPRFLREYICLTSRPVCTFNNYNSATDHSMYVSGFSCTPIASIAVSSVLLSGDRCVPLFVYSGLHFKLLKSSLNTELGAVLRHLSLIPSKHDTLSQCCINSVADDGTTLSKRWVDMSCLQDCKSIYKCTDLIKRLYFL